MDDLTEISDSDLIIAMGTHDDNCGCAHCREWDKRSAARAEAEAEEVPRGCRECGAEIENA